MNDLTAALSEVRSNYVQQQYVDKSKLLIGSYIEALDPTVKVEDTHYFNHSAIPDFVLKWPNERKSRDVYLRGSYAAIIAGHDAAQITKSDPIFLALSDDKGSPDEQSPISAEIIRAEAEVNDFTLLTDISAVGDIREADAGTAGPLTQLVQANFVRGARGLVDDARAVEMISTSREDGRTALSEVLRETFTADAFLRMERTAALVDLALGVDSPDVSVVGVLSRAEIESVVPWALRDERIEAESPFWRVIGDLMSFSTLEEIAGLLNGLDVGPIIRANAEKWRVQRAYVTASDYADAERVTRRWQFLNGTLFVDGEYQRVFMSSNGKALRGRQSTALPRWERIREPLTEFRLASVNLRGVTRSVQIDAERSDDIREDVTNVTTSLTDDYHISDVSLRFSNPASRSDFTDLNLDFGKGLAVSAQGGVTIQEMLASCLLVLSHRRPGSATDVQAMLEDADL